MSLRGSASTLLCLQKWKEFVRERIRVCEIIFISFCFKGQQFFVFVFFPLLHREMFPYHPSLKKLVKKNSFPLFSNFEGIFS